MWLYRHEARHCFRPPLIALPLADDGPVQLRVVTWVQSHTSTRITPTTITALPISLLALTASHIPSGGSGHAHNTTVPAASNFSHLEQPAETSRLTQEDQMTSKVRFHPPPPPLHPGRLTPDFQGKGRSCPIHLKEREDISDIITGWSLRLVTRFHQKTLALYYYQFSSHSPRLPVSAQVANNSTQRPHAFISNGSINTTSTTVSLYHLAQQTFQEPMLRPARPAQPRLSPFLTSYFLPPCHLSKSNCCPLHRPRTRSQEESATHAISQVNVNLAGEVRSLDRILHTMN
jgi:hypothetical protein